MTEKLYTITYTFQYVVAAPEGCVIDTTQRTLGEALESDDYGGVLTFDPYEDLPVEGYSAECYPYGVGPMKPIKDYK